MSSHKFDLSPAKYATVSVCLPFPGFCGTKYEGLIDDEENRFVENCVNESDHEDDEKNFPEPIRLDEDEIFDLTNRHSDYEAVRVSIAEAYVSVASHYFGEALGIHRTKREERHHWNLETSEFTRRNERVRRPTLLLEAEEMTSPREYNFETDRIFARMPLVMAREMFARSKREGHKALAGIIRDRFTSCSGFVSSYSNDIAEWLEKPLASWDHNEVGTLLLAALALAGVDADELDWSIYYTITEDSNYWENCIDWPKFEADRLEKRAEKLAAWVTEDAEAVARFKADRPDTLAAILAAADVKDVITIEDALGDLARALPYHCPETPDLFPATLK